MIEPKFADQEDESVEISALDLNRLRVLCPLGRGAKGVVFRVRVPGSGEDLALKVVLQASLKSKNGSKSSGSGGNSGSNHDCRKNKKGRIWFEQEVLSSLRHPLLPRLRGVVETEKVVGYAIDYCPGRDLNWVRRQQSEKMFSDDIVRFYGRTGIGTGISAQIRDCLQRFEARKRVNPRDRSPNACGFRSLHKTRSEIIANPTRPIPIRKRNRSLRRSHRRKPTVR